MAQAHGVQVSRSAHDALTSLTEEKRYILQQYEKIVSFSDAVFSGKHPSIKPPSSIASRQPSIPRAQPSADTPIGAGNVPAEQRHSAIEHSSDSIIDASQVPAPNGTLTISKPFSSGNTKINPILLEKSDDLIKAEIQLQRQRLERSLKEELEQRRAAVRNATQGEPTVDFDLSDVLSKALTLVQASASAAPLLTDENVTAANQDAASDSFDDNTFYSSRHDTPESHLTSRVRNESEEARVPAVAQLQQSSNSQANTQSPKQRDNASSGNLNPNAAPWQSHTNVSSNSVNNATGSIPQSGQVPGLNNYSNDKAVPLGPSQEASFAKSRTEDFANVSQGQQGGNYGRDRYQQPSYIDNRPPSPLVRAHELSPVAPQPAHVSSLALASRLPAAAEPVSNQSPGTPAQVAALRNEPTVITSPDSSPSGGRPPEKKKPKKKKRKADRQVPEPEATPYIKPEPRSPSPLNAPSYIRPTKRQRHTQRPGDEPEYEAPRFEGPNTSQHETYAPRTARDHRIPVGYERTSMHPPRSTSVVMASSQPYAREYVDDRRIAGETYVVRPPAYANEEVVWRNSDVEHDPRIQRRVVDSYGQSPQSHRGAYEAPRVSVRPETERYVEVPPRPPTRIVVDAFGREYIEPPRSTLVRPSAIPSVRPDDPEIIYERTVPRAATRHVGVESYEEGTPIYRRSSPSYGMPRRVVTQPEYLSQAYRDNRQREYSTRPLAPQGEFVEVMAPPERRRLGEPPRDYVTRAASVRPAEPLRYEVPYEYGRVQSVRPEVPVRQYAASIHPESRREVAQPYLRDYGVRTAEQPAIRQEYSVRPVEQYYEQPMRAGDDIAFIERPRGATQEIVYADDARREVYR